MQHDQVGLLIGDCFLTNQYSDGRVVDRFLSVVRFAIHSSLSVTSTPGDTHISNWKQSYGRLSMPPTHNSLIGAYCQQ
ncbi:hypothetical protein VN97_g12209 [Penicillium thymicola]|uniref:Uncharacterized protein n=1 Tax=Penicillium thymicola TaxID=293382 RepID=A0AAI9T6H6_PENTH|nr:hypothetical protein VN97_g12209 [Penicillium thymicola]